MTPRLLPFVTVTLSLALCSGCKSGDDDDNAGSNAPATNSSCTVTLSGAIERTDDCTASWLQSSQLADPNPYLGIAELDGSSGFDLFDQSPKVGTWTSGGSFKATALAVDKLGVGQHNWHLYENSGSENVGTYSVTITGVSEGGNSSGFHFWSVDGTIDATLAADESSGATGEVQMHLDF
jgi:hypothetical protein